MAERHVGALGHPKISRPSVYGGGQAAVKSWKFPILVKSRPAGANPWPISTNVRGFYASSYTLHKLFKFDIIFTGYGGYRFWDIQKYTVTMKHGLRVTQGHRNRYVSIRRLWLPINVAYIHGPISYRFRVKRWFRSKIAKFSHPCVFCGFCAPADGVPLWVSALGVKKTQNYDGATGPRKKFNDILSRILDTWSMMGWEESFFKCPYLASAGPDGSWRRWPTEHQQFLAWGYSNDGLLCCWRNTFWSPDGICWLLAFFCGPWACIRCRWVQRIAPCPPFLYL